MKTWLPMKYYLLPAVLVVAGLVYFKSQQDLGEMLFKEGDSRYFNAPAFTHDFATQQLLLAEDYYSRGLDYKATTPDRYFRLGHAATASGNYERVRLGFQQAIAGQYNDPILQRLIEQGWSSELDVYSPTHELPDTSALIDWQMAALPGDLRAAGYEYLWVPHRWIDGLTDIERELVLRNVDFYIPLIEGFNYNLYQAVGDQQVATSGFLPEDFETFQNYELPAPLPENTIILNPVEGLLSTRQDVIGIYGVYANGQSTQEKERLFKELKILQQVVHPDALTSLQQAKLRTWLETFDPGDLPADIEYVVLHEAWLNSLSAESQAKLRDPALYEPLDWQVNFYYEIYTLYHVNRTVK